MRLRDVLAVVETSRVGGDDGAFIRDALAHGAHLEHAGHDHPHVLLVLVAPENTTFHYNQSDLFYFAIQADAVRHLEPGESLRAVCLPSLTNPLMRAIRENGLVLIDDVALS